MLSSPIQCSTLFTDDPQVKGNCVLDIDMDGIPNSDVRRPKHTSNKVHACKIHTYIEHGRITNASGYCSAYMYRKIHISEVSHMWCMLCSM